MLAIASPSTGPRGNLLKPSISLIIMFLCFLQMFARPTRPESGASASASLSSVFPSLPASLTEHLDKPNGRHNPVIT